MTHRFRSMRMFVARAVVLAVACAPGAWGVEPTRCETLGGARGIRVCEQPIEDSKFHRYRVTGALCASVPEIVSLLMNMDTVHEWFPEVIEARHLASGPDAEMVYIVNRAPWPLKPRDLVYRFELEHYSPGGPMRVRITGVPDAVARVKNYVRIESANGGWSLVPREATTEVTFAMHLELGAVPALVANRRVREIVLGAMRNLGDRFPCG